MKVTFEQFRELKSHIDFDDTCVTTDNSKEEINGSLDSWHSDQIKLDINSKIISYISLVAFTKNKKDEFLGNISKLPSRT